MKFLVSFCIIFWIFSTYMNNWVECKENDADQYFTKLRERVRRIAEEVKKGGEIVVGRKDDMDPYSRPTLPVNWLEQPLSNIDCGSTNLVAKSGYFIFELNSKDKQCKMDFIGSKKYKCQVAIYCHSVLRFKPPNENNECVEEYLQIYDGTSGRMGGCDPFSFYYVARTPRNGGRDLYIAYKGYSKYTKCVMFCSEDLTDAHKETIKRFRVISRNRDFLNYPNQGSCECGKRMDLGRIVGGEVAKKFEFPWQGAIVQSNPLINRYPGCGVVLISDRHALTAAHCLDHENVNRDFFEVIFHSHLLNQRPNFVNDPYDENEVRKHIPEWDLPVETDQSEGTVRKKLDSFLLHPLFFDNEKNFDIAILTFRTPINFTEDKVSPICLPKVEEYREYKEDEDIMTLSGWGETYWGLKVNSRLLRKVDQTYLHYKGLHNYCQEPKFTLFSAADWGVAGNSACQGDSGSSLVYKINESKNQYLLTGIMHANIICAYPYIPDVYIDVQEVVQWVYYHIMDDRPNWCKR